MGVASDNGYRVTVGVIAGNEYNYNGKWQNV